jgi:hypothetical protein
MERLRIRLFAGLAACGLLMIGLSFLPWVRFHSLTFAGDTAPPVSVTFSGAHISRWRDLNSVGRNDVQSVNGWCSCDVSLGDGYLTAGLGLAVFVVALGGWLTGRDRAAAMAGIVASISALGLAGFDAIAKWSAYIWTTAQDLEVANGRIQLGLIALVAACIVAALLSGAIWSFATVERLVDEELMEQEGGMTDDEMNSEATAETES